MGLDYIRLRREKDAFFKTHPQSPIPRLERPAFVGLRYYAPDEAYVLWLQPERYPDSAPVLMPTSTGDTREFVRWARLNFEIGPESASLTLYYAPQQDYFFLPFMDATNGAETYGAGRYLDPEFDEDNGGFLLDFNLAYFPYCAYNPHYSCPIPPAENRLKVRIEAGERL